MIVTCNCLFISLLLVTTGTCDVCQSCSWSCRGQRRFATVRWTTLAAVSPASRETGTGMAHPGSTVGLYMGQETLDPLSYCIWDRQSWIHCRIVYGTGNHGSTVGLYMWRATLDPLSDCIWDWQPWIHCHIVYVYGSDIPGSTVNL